MLGANRRLGRVLSPPVPNANIGPTVAANGIISTQFLLLGLRSDCRSLSLYMMGKVTAKSTSSVIWTGKVVTE